MPERSMTPRSEGVGGASGVCERAEAYDDDASSALREAAASAWRDAPLKSDAVSVSRGTARIPPDARRITKGASMPRMPKGSLRICLCRILQSCDQRGLYH